MSGLMHKISDAITGHHHTNTTNATNTTGLNTHNTNLPVGNQQGGVGTGYGGTNYSSTNSGALKEGAQVRDTGMNSGRSNTAAYDSYNSNTTGSSLGTNSSHLGRDAALATGAGALGSSALNHHHNTSSTTGTGMYGSGINSGYTSSNSSYDSSSNSSLGSSSLGSSSLGGSSYQQSSALGREQRSGTYENSTDDAMTRSEEQLVVGKEQVNAGKAALNKYITTEKVSTAVPIVKEHAVIEREPITDANRAAAMAGPDFKESRYEVNLMEERAVAEKETVPIERVRLRKEAEQTQQYVEAELRKEHIDVIDPTQKQFGSSNTSNLQQSEYGRTSQQSSLGSGLSSGSGLGRNSEIDSTTSSSTRRNL